MANTKKWVIAGLDVKPSSDGLTDVVSVIHWRKQATEVVGEGQSYVADMYGACAVAAPDVETFVDFANLKEEDIVAWLEATLDVAAIDTALDIQIDVQKNPPVVSKPLPWIPVVEETTPSQEAAENITE
jgi:hypothetical protein